MANDFLEDRRHALEESFFRRRNAELVEKLREQLQVRARRNELSAASGITDEALLDRLVRLKMNADTISALALVPLVRVAWADNRLEDQERDAVLRAAVESGVDKGTASYHCLLDWLKTQPDEELNDAWSTYVGELCKSLSREDLETLRDGLLTRVRRVAEAAGGFLGLGNKISPAEQKVLDELLAAFQA